MHEKNVTHKYCKIFSWLSIAALELDHDLYLAGYIKVKITFSNVA